MTKDNAAMANDTGLQPVTVETPNGGYSFYRESDADMTTTEGRIEWFCAHFEVERPKLEYDPEEPDAILLTDELIEWTRTEGVSLDWLFIGHVGGALRVYRDKYRITPETAEFAKLLGEFDETEKSMLEAGIVLSAKADADVEEVMREVSLQIKRFRCRSRSTGRRRRLRLALFESWCLPTIVRASIKLVSTNFRGLRCWTKPMT